MDNGPNKVFDKIGVEATGDPFNSIVRLELKQLQKPLNPMINAGAIATTNLILGANKQEKINRIMTFARLASGNGSIEINQAVIFIEEDKSIRDQRMRIIFLNGEEMIYDVETMRFWDKKPKLESEKQSLLEDINRISKEVKQLIAYHELEGEDVHKIALAMTNLTEYLNATYIKDDNFGKQVINVTKTLYDPLVKEEGIKEGIYKVAKALLDILDDETIAVKTGLSKEQVQQLRIENKLN